MAAMAMAGPDLEDPPELEAGNSSLFPDACTSYGELLPEVQLGQVMDALREQRAMLSHILARLPPIEGAGQRQGCLQGKPCPEVTPPSPEDEPQEWRPAAMLRRVMLFDGPSEQAAPSPKLQAAAPQEAAEDREALLHSALDRRLREQTEQIMEMLDRRFAPAARTPARSRNRTTTAGSKRRPTSTEPPTTPGASPMSPALRTPRSPRSPPTSALASPRLRSPARSPAAHVSFSTAPDGEAERERADATTERPPHIILQIEDGNAATPGGRGRATKAAGEDGAAAHPTLLESNHARSSSGTHLPKVDRARTDELSLQSSHASDFSPSPRNGIGKESRSMSSLERQVRRVAFHDRTSTLKSMKSRLGFVRRIDFSDSMVRVATTFRHTSQSVGPGRMQEWLIFLADWFERLLTEGEPPREGFVNRLVNHNKPFELFCLSVIVFNGFFVGYTTNYEMAHFDPQPGQDWSQVQPLATPKEWLYIEIAMVIWYCIEITLRISVHKMYYFFNEEAKWNIFDFWLVAFSIVDLIGSNSNIGFFRMVRVFKVVKVLRTLRAMRFFQELRLMVDCALGSFMQLLWCLVVIAFILYLFSLVFVQGATDFLVDLVKDQSALPAKDAELYTGVVGSFGSVQHAMLLLLQSVTGGLDWQEMYDLILLSGDWRAAVYVFYILFFVVAIWNIITSVFVEKVLKLAQPDIDTLMMEQRRKDDEDAKELRELFRKQDVDCSGTISAEEFERCIKNGEVESFLVGRGIDIKDAKTFFTMLSESMDKENEVDIGTVVGSCLRIKGVATSIDLQMLRYEARTAARRQAELTKVVHSLTTYLGSGGSGSELDGAAPRSSCGSAPPSARGAGPRRGRSRPSQPEGAEDQTGYYGLLTL